VLSSGDTRDHVRAIKNETRFWESFAGMPLEQLAEPQWRRSVAGSTLTSRAIAAALALRVGGSSPASRFDAAPTLADLVRLFPEAAEVEADPGDASVIRVRGNDGLPLGWALRTSPAADGVIGYQGPTDAIVGMNTTGMPRVQAMYLAVSIAVPPPMPIAMVARSSTRAATDSRSASSMLVAWTTCNTPGVFSLRDDQGGSLTAKTAVGANSRATSHTSA